MQTSVERRDGDTVELTVLIPAEDVSEAVTEAYSRVSGRLRIPGFRPGKAPREVVDNRVGRDAVMQDALEDIVENSYPLALDAEDLRPVDKPEFGELGPIVEGADYEYTATLETRPQLELSLDEPLAVTVPSPRASETELTVQTHMLRERYAQLVPVERGIEEGDFSLISFVGHVDGEEYPDNRVDRYLYEPGTGIMPRGFDEGLWGAKAGESVRSEFVIPDSSSNPEFVGKTAVFEIEVHEVKAKELPELDDAFAAEVGGFASYEEFREEMRRSIEDQKASGQQNAIEQAVRAALAERLVGNVPDKIVEHRAQNMAEDFFEMLRQRQMSIEDYARLAGIEPDSISGDIKERALQVVREELALEALCRAKGMTATDVDVEAEVTEIAGTEPGAVDRLRDRLKAAGMLPILREQIMHRKALAWLGNNVVVTEEEPADEPAAKAVASGKKTAAAKRKKSTAAAASEEGAGDGEAAEAAEETADADAEPPQAT